MTNPTEAEIMQLAADMHDATGCLSMSTGDMMGSTAL